ncbi:MAG: helix-turn-helix domain-containing protein [Spirochaetales bacterium]|jgi:excisionase family DNA binding protein|nr:helix-turn-helix domain-containing protein [Spirochaetales bacterium]
MKPFTFDQIPKLIGKLFDKMERIELLLKSLSPETKQQEELLNIAEAAKLLNLSVPTIYSKVSRNEIPVCKKGKRLYFYKSELLSWIKSGKVKTIEEIHSDVEKRLNNH